jgi:hypothetical protein
MIIYGHRFIPSNNFYHVVNIDAISNTPPSSTLFLEFKEENLDIIEHLRVNELPFALQVNSITELVYASALNASFMIVSKELMLDAQNIANEYLFDAKILVKIEDDSEIEELAKLSIDGVIYSNAIIKTNS